MGAKPTKFSMEIAKMW